MIRNFKINQPRNYGPRTSHWSHIVSGKEIQHIIVYMDPIKYINMTFDMDICKNWFDGKKLYIKSWSNLILRKDYIKPNALLIQFYTDNIYVRELSEQRIKKYRNKGFDINYHPLYNEIAIKIQNLIDSCDDNRFFKQTDEWHFDMDIY